MTTKQKELYPVQHILYKRTPRPGYGEPQWKIDYDRLDFYLKKDEEIGDHVDCHSWIRFDFSGFKRFISELTGLDWSEAVCYYDCVEIPVA